jgi:hypothetical protein
MKAKLVLTVLTLAAATAFGVKPILPTVSGTYVEVRSCDVYTGACVANSEMGHSGREGILVWSVKHGVWNGVKLDGLNVIAVVHTDDTLGDVRYQPRRGQAVFIVDRKADSRQAAALENFARSMAGKLAAEVVEIKTAPIDVAMGKCSGGACATVKADNLVEISTRCLDGKDHLCGNEENFYPPLTQVEDAFTAYTELAAFKGTGLNLTWELTGKRSAYLATFAK